MLVRLYRTGKMSVTSWGIIYFEMFSFHKNIKPFCGLLSGIGEHPTTAVTDVKLFCSGLAAPEALAEGSDAPSCRNVPCRTPPTCRPEEMPSTYWRAGLNFGFEFTRHFLRILSPDQLFCSSLMCATTWYLKQILDPLPCARTRPEARRREAERALSRLGSPSLFWWTKRCQSSSLRPGKCKIFFFSVLFCASYNAVRDESVIFRIWAKKRRRRRGRAAPDCANT